MRRITTLEELEAAYPRPVSPRARWKELDHIDDYYRRFIEASPFLLLATSGEQGIDCSPRGDAAGFVRVVDGRHLQIPDRRGNNRLDTLRNLVADPRIGLFFLVPNAGETLRVSGRAEILVDADLCRSFAVRGKPASSVLSVRVDKAYYQCQKAIVRSRLWDPASHPEPEALPTAGQLAEHFSALHGESFDGAAYDEGYDEYLRKVLY